MRRLVALSILGTTLDAAGGFHLEERRRRWRPTVALCRQPGLKIDRLEMLYSSPYEALAKRVCADAAQVSPDTEIRRRLVDWEDPWDFSEVYTAMRDFAQSYPFDPDHEDYLVNITTGTHVAQICWFLLTEARMIPGRLIQLFPRKIEDPDMLGIGGHAIIDLDLSRYDAIATRFAAEREDAASFLKSGVETRNAAFNAMIDQIEKVAIRSRAPVLLTGPTGAGKSQLARRIYELKQARRQVSGGFVEANCATLRGDQAMSALFGHAKGAFTGAVAARAGLMKSADQGMLFLDEIGELGLDEQAMCLRAIEEKRFLPVGADKEVASDFQLIAGTNRDLAAEARAGRFREDLLARLNLWSFELPALKDRREDIEPNLEFELKRFREREGLNATFNKEARRIYLDFALSEAAIWSANFRDLAASVTRMAILAPLGRIDAPTAQAEIAGLKRRWGADDESEDAALRGLLGAEKLAGIDLFDRAQLAKVVAVCRASPSASAAGRKLFGVSRLAKSSANDADRLRKYLARFDLSFDEVKKPALT